MVQFGKYGTIGVVLASLFTVIAFGGIIYKMSANFAETTKEMNESTNTAMNKNTAALTELNTFLTIKMK